MISHDQSRRSCILSKHNVYSYVFVPSSEPWLVSPTVPPNLLIYNQVRNSPLATRSYTACGVIKRHL